MLLKDVGVGITLFARENIPFFSAATTGMLALLLAKIDKLLITLSLLPLLDRERGVGFFFFFFEEFDITTGAHMRGSWG